MGRYLLMAVLAAIAVSRVAAGDIREDVHASLLDALATAPQGSVKMETKKEAAVALGQSANTETLALNSERR
jgi:hypothetical protein